MLASQRPRTSLRSSGGGGSGLIAMFGTPAGRTALSIAVIVAIAGAALLVWHNARKNAATELAGETPGPVNDTFIPTTPARAEASAPQVTPDAPPAPVVLSMDPRATGPTPFGSTSTPATVPSTKPIAFNPPAPSTPTGPSAMPLELPANPGVQDGLASGKDPSTATAAMPTDLDLRNAPARSSASAGGDGKRALDEAARLVQSGKLADARITLNNALMSQGLSEDVRGQLRAQAAAINEMLIFSPTVSSGDPLTDSYTVKSGDSLARIARQQGLPIDWRLLQRINRMSSPNALRVGQKLKLVRMPFHAVVHKATYRMDIFAGPPVSPGATASEFGPDGQHKDWTYIRSFRVGLGETNGTPEGTFVVRPNSKLVDPRWVNPRTGEVFEKDNPKNPIGEHWIGLDGADDASRPFTGYGIHGTIDPASVGQQRSMGCVRLVAEDIAMVYELLVDRLSTVRITQ